MIKIIVAGAVGKMGSAIIKVISSDYNFKLVGATEQSSNKLLNQDAGEIAGIGNIGVKIISDLTQIISECDVVIDFTSPKSSLENIKIASTANKAMVIGTTGLSSEDKKEIEKFTKNIPCVMSPNMSIGVNILFKLAKDVAAILGEDFDTEIIEAHHRFKKDAPSGTAVHLAEIIAQAKGVNIEESGVYGRKGITGERDSKSIGVLAVRAGDIVGDHTVMFGGIGERLELIHRAHSRETFARGALRAAKYVVNAKPGLYDMQDVLNIKS